MKRFFTLFVILLIWAVAAQAQGGFPPLRIAVTNPEYGYDHTLVIDVLQSTGVAFDPAIAITIGHKDTDASGVISIPIVSTTPIDFVEGYGTYTWSTCGPMYNKDYLIRVTYNGVVLSIERMEVMYAKQGLYGTTIGADDIDKTETFVFHDISVGSLTPGTVEAKQLVMKDGQGTPKTITLQTPPDMSTNPSYTLTYPTTVGAVNQVLANDATTPGKLVWADASGATPTAQASNTFYGGPISGEPVTPGFRAIVAGDITDAIVTGKVLTGLNTTAGTPTGTSTILAAIGLLTGTDALKAPLASPVFTGTVKINGATEGFVGFLAPATVTTSYSLTLPTTKGSANQVLANGSTAGTLEWADVTATTATNLADGALGSIPYQNAVDETVFLAGNITATPKFLKQTGDGGEPAASAAPVWSALTDADIPDVLTLTGSVITGVKFGGATDYSQFESDGTLVHFAGATIWKDINLGGMALGKESSAPELVSINASVIKTYAFGKTSMEQLYGTFELQHDYKQGTNIFPHIHWMPINSTLGSVVWKLDYYIIDNLSSTPITGTLSVTSPTGGVAWARNDVEFGTISGSGVLSIGAQISFRLYRETTDPSDTYEDGVANAALLTIGVHYESDTEGSRTKLAK